MIKSNIEEEMVITNENVNLGSMLEVFHHTQIEWILEIVRNSKVLGSVIRDKQESLQNFKLKNFEDFMKVLNLLHADDKDLIGSWNPFILEELTIIKESKPVDVKMLGPTQTYIRTKLKPENATLINKHF
jgi:hypothetical protein